MDQLSATPLKFVPETEAQKHYQNVVFHSVITFIGLSFMQVVDLLFCRDLGSEASATVGTSTSLIAWFMIIGLGLISSLEFFIPKSLGEKNEQQAHGYFTTGIWVACGFSVFSMFGLVALAKLGPWLGVNPLIQSQVELFCTITAPSYFVIFLAPALRVELQARGRPHQATLAFLWANLLNILLNWMFVLGHLGAPAMGIRGSAWANVLSRVGLLFYLLIQVYLVRAHSPTTRLEFTSSLLPRLDYAKDMLRKGIPTSLHLLFEMGAFVFVSTLASRLAPAQNAAHAIALSIASFAFMIPMGLSSGAAVTMSHSLGEGKVDQAKHFAQMTIRLGLYYAVIGSLLMITLRTLILKFYTVDTETIAVGSNILIIASLFQFGDAMQVIFAGILRGVGETKVQAKMNGIGHWLIGIPMGLVLLFYFNLGVVGLWIGLCAGLFAVALGLGWRWKNFPIDSLR